MLTQFFDYWKTPVDDILQMEEQKVFTLYDIAVYKLTGKKPARRYLSENERRRKAAQKDITETHVHHPRRGWITKEKAADIGFVGVSHG